MSGRVVRDYDLGAGLNTLWLGENARILSVCPTASQGMVVLVVEEDRPSPGESQSLARVQLYLCATDTTLPSIFGTLEYVGSAGTTWPRGHVFFVDDSALPPAVSVEVVAPTDEVEYVEVLSTGIRWQPSPAAVAPRWGRPFRQALNNGGRVT